MAFEAIKIPYSRTNYFSKTVIDYLQHAESMMPFIQHSVHAEGLKDSIAARAKCPVNRDELYHALSAQYAGHNTCSAVLHNIELLKNDTTFTITTAHQPNIFTGPLYFLYKILHTARLSAYCKEKFPQYNFVPVYYMGSEDADLDELGHIHLNGRKLCWQTSQTGAVGRMLVDADLLKLVDSIAAEMGVQPYGKEIISLLRKYYTPGATIMAATFGLVNDLFGKYGLIVLIPDNPALKLLALDMFEQELLQGHSAKIIEETGTQLANADYTVQAHSRNVNFFYLRNDKRERFEKQNGLWKVVGTQISFTKEQLLQELNAHPERFSPNVILRGLFQEMILPNIAFIGGGGELAYWLQLKNLFLHYGIPYPVLVLRNSYLIVNEWWRGLQRKLHISDLELFDTVPQLQKKWIEKNSNNTLHIAAALDEISDVYSKLLNQAATIDTTLLPHIEALRANALNRIKILDKKMLRAEKRNHYTAMNQIVKLKAWLFPQENLQERMDNFIPYYAAYGPGFIDDLYKSSLPLTQEFTVLLR